MKFTIKELQELRKSIKPIESKKAKKKTKKMARVRAQLPHAQPSDHMKGYSELPSNMNTNIINPYLYQALGNNALMLENANKYMLNHQDKELQKLQEKQGEFINTYKPLIDNGMDFINNKFRSYDQKFLTYASPPPTIVKDKDEGADEIRQNLFKSPHNSDFTGIDQNDLYDDNIFPEGNPMFPVYNERNPATTSANSEVDEDTKEPSPAKRSKKEERDKLILEYMALGGKDPKIVLSTRKKTIEYAIKDLRGEKKPRGRPRKYK
jgi:hypothetical protein